MNGKNFIESFVNKVIASSTKCHSCKHRRELCMNYDCEYIHSTESAMEHYINDIECDDIYKDTVKNVILTFFHNADFSKRKISRFVTFYEYMYSSMVKTTTFRGHTDCFKFEKMPNYLLEIQWFNGYCYVRVFENVYDYYENRNTEPFVEERLIYFKKWVEEILQK